MAASMARFKSEHALGDNTSDEQLIDALETAARRRAKGVGLELCNRTAGRLWSSIARRRGEGWESRGWWALGPGGCAKTLDEPLLQSVYFVAAVLESPQGQRALSASGESFCTSPAKFAILGREKCKEREYDTGLFTPISSQGREGMTVEFFERDFLSPGATAKQLNLPKMSDADVAATPQGGRAGFAPNSAAAAEEIGEGGSGD
jgi:uncharacterized membrane protein